MTRGLRCIVGAVFALTLAVPAPALAAAPRSGGPGISDAAGAGSAPSAAGVATGPVAAAAGPEILSWPAARAPQLENTGIWQAPPILVSGVSAYRLGEFLYQDFLYDDSGTYPADARYAKNAADFVELRMKPLAAETAIRITYNSMLDPTIVGTTIALGDSADSRPVPHGARAQMRAKLFVTVHGTTADVIDAASGAVLGAAPVTVDLERRQVEVRVPYDMFDPRGNTDVRVAAATGVWDPATDGYAKTDAGAAFFNVAFRYNQPLEHFVETAQNAALASGDLSSFSAHVDFTKLAAGVTDDSMVPASGDMDIIHASQFETVQGRGSNAGDITGGFRCNDTASGCTYEYAGQLQPYKMRVPVGPPPPGGWGLVLTLHGSGTLGDYNGPDIGVTDDASGRAANTITWNSLSQTWNGAIVVSPEGRGESLFYWGQSGADVWEDVADVMRRYAINPLEHMASGVSMGGCGAYKLGVQFPDFFTAIYPAVGCTTSAEPEPPAPAVLGGFGTDYDRMLANLRWVPVMAVNAMADPLILSPHTYNNMLTLQQLGYRFDQYIFCDDSASSCGHVDYRGWYNGWVADKFDTWQQNLPALATDPPHVTYVANSVMDEPKYGLNSDHAYWLSNIKVRDATDPPPVGIYGKIDVVSHGFGIGDASANPLQHEIAAGPGSNAAVYQRYTQTWGEAPAASTADVLDVTATNVDSVTIDPKRAHVDCNAVVNVTSDGPLNVTLLGCDGQPVLPEIPYAPLLPLAALTVLGAAAWKRRAISGRAA